MLPNLREVSTALKSAVGVLEPIARNWMYCTYDEAESGGVNLMKLVNAERCAA